MCYSLFFIKGQILGGRVTVTDVECRLYIHNYEHVITQQCVSAMESPICGKFILTNCCPVCFHVMKQPSSEEWHIAIGPDPSKMCVVVS